MADFRIKKLKTQICDLCSDRSNDPTNPYVMIEVGDTKDDSDLLVLYAHQKCAIGFGNSLAHQVKNASLNF